MSNLITKKIITENYKDGKLISRRIEEIYEEEKDPTPIIGVEDIMKRPRTYFINGEEKTLRL